jgi:glutaredoxin
MAALLPQRCYLAVLYLNWVLYFGVAIALALRGSYAFLGVWLIAAPVFMYAYVRLFPRMSPAMGYGSVVDAPAAHTPRTPVRVTMYSGLGCPFCPLMERRLRALQQDMGFELDVVDVTARPGLIRGAAIRSVPTIEVDGRRHAGCITSQELAVLITGDAADSTTAVSAAAASAP